MLRDRFLSVALDPALVGLGGIPLGIAGTLVVQAMKRGWDRADALSAAREAAQRGAGERLSEFVATSAAPAFANPGEIMFGEDDQVRQELVDGWIAQLRPLRAAAALLPDLWFARIDTLVVCLMHSFLFADSYTVVHQLRKDLRAFLAGAEEPTEVAAPLVPTYELMSAAMRYKFECSEGRFDYGLAESRRQLTDVLKGIPAALPDGWSVILEPFASPARVLAPDEDFIFQGRRVIAYATP
ncbi:MAG: hypothetical protein M3256_25165 [Actinomycetota bacterium]|nr:hypothetical protein [Actinomycetota bacterium]